MCTCVRVRACGYMYACACTFARARVSMCAAFMRVYIWQCMYTYVYICVSICQHKSAFRQYPSRALLGNDQLSICHDHSHKSTTERDGRLCYVGRDL